MVRGRDLVPAVPACGADSFADRRIASIRKAVRGWNPLGRAKLPAVLCENSGDVCPRDQDGKRVLPDGSQWVVSGALWREDLHGESAALASVTHEAGGRTCIALVMYTCQSALPPP